MEKFKKILKEIFFSFAWLFVLLLVTDIVTKLVVSRAIPIDSDEHIVLIPGFLRISCTGNANAAFGMGIRDATTNRIIYIIVAILATCGLMFYYIRNYKKTSKYIKACLMLITTGAVGNLIDRLFYSFSDYCVIDWIDFYGIWKYNFNIADSCIVIGVIMLMVWLIVEEVKEYKLAKANTSKEPVETVSSEEKKRLERDEKDKKDENI